MTKSQYIATLVARKNATILEMAKAVIANDVETAKRLQSAIKADEALIAKYTKQA